jgi:hypothetical protein
MGVCYLIVFKKNEVVIELNHKKMINYIVYKINTYSRYLCILQKNGEISHYTKNFCL